MKTIKLFTFFILLLSKSASLYAQNWLWAKDGGTTPEAHTGVVIVNTNSNIYINGAFLDSISFGATTYHGWSNSGNGFIAEYSQSGDFAAVGRISKANMQSGFGMGTLNHDNLGNIYIPGQVSGSNTFDTIQTNSVYGGFIAKFNADLHGLNVSYASDLVHSSAFDVEQSMYLIGTITRAITHIDTFALYNLNPQPLFNPKTFLAKLDSAQKCVWVKQTMAGAGELFQLKIYGNSLYSLGVVDSCLLLDTATICNTNLEGSSFLAKTTTEGNLIWAKNYTAAGLAFFTAMDIDNSGNCYVSGWLDSTAYFGSDTLYKTPGSIRNTFLAKYDSLGAVVWARHIDCMGDMLCKSISTDSNGNTYLTGNFSGNASFGNDVILAQSSSDGYITRFDKNGNCLGGKTIGNVTCNSIAQDADGNAIVTGNLNTGTTYFDSIPLTCTGQSNFFLAKLEAIKCGNNSVRMMRVDDRLVIYANPNTGSFTIEVPQGIVRGNRAQLGIYNSTGGMVKDEAVDISNNRLSIDIGSVQKGIYSVTLSSGQRRYTGRVVVE